jgi:serine/threonine protein kinase
MKILDIEPKYITRPIAKKICNNKYLLRKYLSKYDLIGGRLSGGSRRRLRPITVPKNGPIYLRMGYNIDGYIIEEQISTGSDGTTIYRCSNDTTNYVLKIMHINFNTPTLFQNEVHILQICKEMEWVIKYIISGSISEYYYIITAYYSNGDLNNTIIGESLKPIEKVNVAIGICNGLKEIHAQNIIHRDIKPENIFLDNYNKPYIGDFGNAVITRNGSIKDSYYYGTPNYSAPESVRMNDSNKYTWSEKSDIWSFGQLLYTLLCGDHLNGDIKENEREYDYLSSNIDNITIANITIDKNDGIPTNIKHFCIKLLKDILKIKADERPTIDYIILKLNGILSQLPKPEPEPEPEPKLEPEQEPKPEPNPKPEPEPKLEPEQEPKPEPEPNPKPKPEPKPEQEQESGPKKQRTK